MSVNIQPLLDLVGHAGDLTSEWKAAKTTGRFAMILWLLSVVVTLCGLSGSVFPGSHAAIVVGSVGTALGVIVQALSGAHFTAGRQNLKTDAVTALQVLGKAAAAGQVVLTTEAPTVPAAPAVQTVK